MKKRNAKQTVELMKGDRVRTTILVDGFFWNPGPDLPEPLPVGGQATVQQAQPIDKLGLCRIKYRDAKGRTTKANIHQSYLQKI